MAKVKVKRERKYYKRGFFKNINLLETYMVFFSIEKKSKDCFKKGLSSSFSKNYYLFSRPPFTSRMSSPSPKPKHKTSSTSSSSNAAAASSAEAAAAAATAELLRLSSSDSIYGRLANFEIDRKIGKGQFSVVYRARWGKEVE